jgi:hypothetical protein
VVRRVPGGAALPLRNTVPLEPGQLVVAAVTSARQAVSASAGRRPIATTLWAEYPVALIETTSADEYGVPSSGPAGVALAQPSVVSPASTDSASSGVRGSRRNAPLPFGAGALTAQAVQTLPHRLGAAAGRLRRLGESLQDLPYRGRRPESGLSSQPVRPCRAACHCEQRTTSGATTTACLPVRASSTTSATASRSMPKTGRGEAGRRQRGCWNGRGGGGRPSCRHRRLER